MSPVKVSEYHYLLDLTLAAIDTCVLKKTNESSVCIPLDDCEEAKRRLQIYNEFPQDCGYIRRKPIVCCPKGREPGNLAREGSYTYTGRDEVVAHHCLFF